MKKHLVNENKIIMTLYNKLGSATLVAEELGVPERTMSRKIRDLKKSMPQPVVTKKEATIQVEDLLQKMRDSLAKADPIKPFPPRKADGESLVIELTDWHIGARDKDANGVNRYDLTISVNRARDLCRKIISLTKQHIMEGTRIDEIVVCLVGDMVDGDDMYPSQIADIEFQPTQQVKHFVEVFRDLIMGLQEFKVPINIYAVPGNHGRTGKDKSPLSNWDTMAYIMFADWIATSKPKLVSFNFTEGEMLVINVRGHNIGLIHKTVLTLAPSAALSRLQAWVNSENIELVLTGHWHHFGIEEAKGWRKYMAGSLMGTNTYAEKLGVGAPPSQLIFGTTKRHISSFIYVVDLH